MIKFFPLFALLACSTPSSQEKPMAKASQKSPYTVEECYCMKIYAPVCGANGVTYGNSCEAECQKQSWQEGACPQK